MSKLARMYKPRNPGEIEVFIQPVKYQYGRELVKIYCTRGKDKKKWHRGFTIKDCSLGAVTVYPVVGKGK